MPEASYEFHRWHMSDEYLAAPVAVVDVHYTEPGARAACVVAGNWSDAVALEEQVADIGGAQPYRPGAFYERELPCILQVMSRVRTAFGTIVIDGYVDLDERGTPGLGAHLFEHFAGKHAVVGVAKTAYRGSSFAAHVLRGDSARPLFVTARGMPLDEAARNVQAMHGEHRIPTLLNRVDQLARGTNP